MDWVREFYARQDQLAGVYQQEVGESDRRRALAVRRHLPAGGTGVLELGCGGGQTAAAIADLGLDVTAVDLNPSAVRHARALAEMDHAGCMEVMEADFLQLQRPAPVDCVCCFDGFGVGDDGDQARLLRLICGWLKPGGVALIEIYTPWYWQAMAGREMRFGRACRRYGFDAGGRRMLDTWWDADSPAESVTQSLRCYTPAELQKLARGSNLVLTDMEPGGAVDYEQGRFLTEVPLEQAMSFLAILRRAQD